MERRNFLKQAAAAAAGWNGATGQAIHPTLLGAAAHTPLPIVNTVNGIGRRRLGRTDTQLSILGIGGYHLG